MAHHGGSTSMPRAHRPRAHIMNSTPAPPPIQVPLAQLRSTTGNSNNSNSTLVTLTVPRPDNERISNEYVDNPFRSGATPSITTHSTTSTNTLSASSIPPTSPPARTAVPRPARLDLPPHATILPSTVSKQPMPTTSFVHHHLPPAVKRQCFSRPSILCPECGLCRCETCQEPAELPQKWVCDGTCLLSADTVTDYGSCLCCVKGLFYHCSDTDDEIAQGENCADNPCGCGPDRRIARWGCLGALSVVLPCLWLYWPLRGCKRAVEVCYSRHSRSGCQCSPPAVHTPEKRLLDASVEF